ncbi:MAG: hypothetical protein OXQ90_19415 [Gammaproteobacteria bacterium]|nr:hypothetical protein [Gammaproteobacteria bacterium]
MVPGGVRDGNVLVETFSHEQADGRLLQNLTEKLEAHGVPLSPIPHEETFAALDRRGWIDPFTRLVATFLQHFKGSRLSLDDIAERASPHRDRKRAEAFIAVFRPVYERYQEALADVGEIDFHDMINQATILVEEGRYRSPFGYILVTELIHGGYDIEVFGRPPQSDEPCPRCIGGGRLKRRENARDQGVFYGCSNFPLCEYTARACPSCGTGLPVRSGWAYLCRDCFLLVSA